MYLVPFVSVNTLGRGRVLSKRHEFSNPRGLSSFIFVTVKLNAGRTVSGILRGFDPYMNIVLDDTVEERSSNQKFNIGMVVSIEGW